MGTLGIPTSLSAAQEVIVKQIVKAVVQPIVDASIAKHVEEFHKTAENPNPTAEPEA